jgi:hypothetical protein
VDLYGCSDNNDYARGEEGDNLPALGAADVDVVEDCAGEEDECCVGDDVECGDGFEECVLSIVSILFHLYLIGKECRLLGDPYLIDALSCEFPRVRKGAAKGKGDYG